ncbi:hypothetical protein KIN20_020527 [Parelaphostrongylus tenuis]|uniref:Uncharacterized protein n=1 Tax=Parelaphostrongylus tenuis TaxID=148309 RepID=A0AAD5MML3_PARTN|nr:hypothetical protein KIN20_020527 [Parelaphostrongylus tenuis]
MFLAAAAFMSASDAKIKCQYILTSDKLFMKDQTMFLLLADASDSFIVHVSNTFIHSAAKVELECVSIPHRN